MSAFFEQSPTWSRWRRLALAAGLVLLTVAVLLATTSNRDPVQSNLDRLASLEEAKLLFPGSKLIRTGGIEDPPPTLHSLMTQVLGTDASSDAVLDFYLAELAGRGFATGGGSSGVPTTSEEFACAWNAGDLTVRLGIADLDDHYKRNPQDPLFATVYDRLCTTPGPAASCWIEAVLAHLN